MRLRMKQWWRVLESDSDMHANHLLTANTDLFLMREHGT